jgi:hypothetical protein
VYTTRTVSAGALSLHALAAPTDAEVASVLWEITERTQDSLARRGPLDGEVSPSDDLFADEPPLLSEIYAASLASRIATGPRRGAPVMRLWTLTRPAAARGARGWGACACTQTHRCGRGTAQRGSGCADMPADPRSRPSVWIAGRMAVCRVR